MLVLLSPAKSLDFESRPTTRKATTPRLAEEAARLIDIMRTKSPADLADLMHLSDDLAALNVQRYHDFDPDPPRRATRQAVLAFAGDVYQGMAARERFDERDFTEAQKTVRILSGLYGVLRPLDLVQPHRLEMGTPLVTDRGRSLYDWWGGRIVDMLRQDLAASPGPAVVVNCASVEYAKAARLDEIDARVVTPRFEDLSAGGDYRVVSFFAKRARGEFAAWMVGERVRSARALESFERAGYRYTPEESTPDQPVYRRACTT